MLPEEIKHRITTGFNYEFESLSKFRYRFIIAQNIKRNIPELPAFLIYFILRDLEKQFNYKKDKEEFIQAFFNEIIPILSSKITES